MVAVYNELISALESCGVDVIVNKLYDSGWLIECSLFSSYRIIYDKNTALFSIEKNIEGRYVVLQISKSIHASFIARHIEYNLCNRFSLRFLISMRGDSNVLSSYFEIHRSRDFKLLTLSPLEMTNEIGESIAQCVDKISDVKGIDGCECELIVSINSTSYSGFSLSSEVLSLLSSRKIALGFESYSIFQNGNRWMLF